MSEIIKVHNKHKQSCDADSCEAEATELIEIRVGKHGSIVLSLCKNCVSKFWDDYDND